MIPYFAYWVLAGLVGGFLYIAFFMHGHVDRELVYHKPATRYSPARTYQLTLSLITLLYFATAVLLGPLTFVVALVLAIPNLPEEPQ